MLQGLKDAGESATLEVGKTLAKVPIDIVAEMMGGGSSASDPSASDDPFKDLPPEKAEEFKKRQEEDQEKLDRHRAALAEFERAYQEYKQQQQDTEEKRLQAISLRQEKDEQQRMESKQKVKAAWLQAIKANQGTGEMSKNPT